MKYRKKLSLFTLFLVNLVDQPAPEVTIEQGSLSGKISVDGSFFEYTGIPYATTNKSSRFQAPQPPPSWEGVYKAIDDYWCPQRTPLGVVGSEDCLKINVYVPAMARKPLPVMVYIHGGAFVLGNGGKLTYGPDFLVKQDVILVTFNYRLGALGFLCLGIKEAPGNAGIKDQIAALRWVKKNIAAFGGDPDNVTLFGESAGAASASILLASEATNGLFNRVIIQSSSSLANWGVTRKPLQIARNFAKSLGHNVEDPFELYKLFSSMPYLDTIPPKFLELSSDLFFNGNEFLLPCVEKSFPGVEPALTDMPYNLLNKATKNVPVIYGSTDKEGYLLLAHEADEMIENMNIKYLFDGTLKFSSDADAKAADNRLRKFYFNNEHIIRAKHFMNISDYFTDIVFEVPAILESELVLKKSNASVYNFYFVYDGGRNYVKNHFGLGNKPGACHGDELAYLFQGSIYSSRINAKDRKIIEYMTKMWTNFAKYGDPTPDQADLPVKWIPSSTDNLNFLYIDEELKMGPVSNMEKYKIWKNLYDKYRRI